jgi:chromosome segregation ATPase
MGWFKKDQFKRRENQNDGSSQRGLREGNVRIANFSSRGPSIQDEQILVQDCFNIVDKQPAKINELKRELNLEPSALDHCLRQTGFSCYDVASLEDELQRKTREITDLRNQLGLLNQRAEAQDRKARETIRQILSQYKAQMDDKTKIFNQQIDKLKTELAQIAQEATTVNNQFDLERSEKNRAQQIVELLDEQLSLKGQKIHEQESQIQTQTDTLQQTRLSLNRTRNELNQEKQRASQAAKESAIKSQQLEFVQQQCASLQEQLRSRNTGHCN